MFEQTTAYYSRYLQSDAPGTKGCNLPPARRGVVRGPCGAQSPRVNHKSQSPPMAATLDLLGMLGRSMLRAALRLCCLPEQTIDGIERRHMQRDDGGAHLICYLDGMSEELVRRQLEFRRTRKLERSASRTSLSSLDAVSEDGLLDPGGLLHSGGRDRGRRSPAR